MNIKKIMAIGAHFDDIEINCGGTIAKAIKEGSSVLMVVAGDGEFYHHTGEILRTKSQALRESRKAALKLGVVNKNLICLDFPEKSIPYNVEIIEKIDALISFWNPDIIFTHWANDTHQDHANVSKTVLSAARYHNSILMWEPIFPSGRTAISSFYPQIYIDISDVQEQKIQALKCHESQIKKFTNRGINWIDGIIARSKYRGFEISCNYAEAFQPVRMKFNIS
ncbi:MAG: PIG-L family deacetylase [Candidatus Pacebacteria bacterium]|nr:PIG-L family deacetylase [Candidatus Paceibacterota bacterium]